MSIDKIQFSPRLIGDLYRNVLIESNHAKAKMQADPPTSQLFLGNNAQKIAIIVNNDAVTYLAEKELNFVLDILTACRLSMADVALFNFARNQSLSYTEITGQTGAEKLILFGVDPSQLQLPLQFPHYQIQQFNGQVYLSAPGLNEMAEDKALKMKLWNCLKQVFTIG